MALIQIGMKRELVNRNQGVVAKNKKREKVREI